jgi:hypothetical protein
MQKLSYYTATYLAFIAKLAQAAKVTVTYLFTKYITSSTCRNSSNGDLPVNFKQHETKKQDLEENSLILFLGAAIH